MSGWGSTLAPVGQAIRLIATQYHLRALFLAITAYGITYGSAVPFIAVWLTRDFGASEFEVGVLITVRGLGGALGVPILGWWSDRSGDRRPGIILAFGVVLVSNLALIFAPSYPVALVAAAFSGLSAVALAFVLVEDVIDRLPQAQGRHRTSVSANERMAFNLGGSMGSALGSLAIAATGFLTGGFMVAAAAAVAGMALMAWWPKLGDPVVNRPATPGGGAGRTAVALGTWLALGGFLLAQFTLFTAVWTRSIFLPLYITGPLDQPPEAVGFVFSSETAVAIFLAPFAGLFLNRVGAVKGIIGNLLFAAGAMLLIPLATEYWQLFPLAMLLGLGQVSGGAAAIIYSASLIPGRAGLTVSLYTAAFQVAPVVAGLAFGALATATGITGVFVVAGLLVGVGLAALLVGEWLRTRYGRPAVPDLPAAPGPGAAG